MRIDPTPTWPHPLPGSGHDAVSHLSGPPPAGIFRDYDVRGRVEGPFDHDRELLTPFGANVIGRAFGTHLDALGIEAVAVGHDSRAYAPSLANALIEGLLSTGRAVVSLGLSTTPMVYFAQHALSVPAAVAVTASHNPNGWAGFKLSVAPSTTLGPDDIRALWQVASTGSFTRGTGTFVEHSVSERYVTHLAELTPAPEPLDVIIDGANGIAGPIALEAFRAAGHRARAINLELDWRFPNHEPDPELLESRRQLAHAVTAQVASFGAAFDGDGDRLGVTDEGGETVLSDRVLALLAEDVLERRPGATILHDVKCSRLVGDVIRAAGGRAEMCRTGHSHIKQRMRELSAPFAGERSGHFFDALDNLGFDDAIHAALRFAHVVAASGRPVSELVAALPHYVSSPTMQAPCPDEVKHEVVERVATALGEQADPERLERLERLDGVRAEFADGWLLVRASSNLPALVILCEGTDDGALRRNYELLRAVLDAQPEVDRTWENDTLGAGPHLDAPPRRRPT
ncbi:MAG: phosphomannomutase/phosphoglucomutase [Nitriliruptoraceae bacterium]